jgi:hypothetical protein
MEINDVFNRMDKWRHLPDWQLERRADLSFSLYLQEVMAKRFNVTIKNTIIPEFPLLKSPEKDEKQTQRTNKADYAVFSDEPVTHCYLIELKTDMKSIDPRQFKYLEIAKEKDLFTLFSEVKKVFQSTQEKRKYVHLFKYVDDVGLVTCKFLKTQNGNKNFIKYDAWDKIIQDIEIEKNPTKPTIVYIQPVPDDKKKPKPDSFKTITFTDFAEALSEHNDSFTERFCQSLTEWANVAPGELKNW